MSFRSAAARLPVTRPSGPRWERRFVALFALIGMLVAGAALFTRRHSLYLWSLERQSISALQKSAARTETDPWVLLTLGRKLATAGRPHEAIEAYGDGLRRLQTRDDRQLHALLDGELALNLMLLGEVRTARPYMEKALELDPTNVSAMMALGWLLSGQEQHSFAARQFEIVTQVEPRYAPAWHAMGQELLQAKKRTEAEAALRKAVALEPREAGYHIALGNALAVQSKMEEAEQSFLTALRLSPNHMEAREALARARTLKAKTPEEYRAARAELEPLVRQSKDATFLAHIGVLDSQFGQLKSAETYLRKAIALVPSNPETTYALAVVLRRQKREKEAERVLAEFRKLETLHRRVVELEKRIPLDPDNRAMRMELAAGLEESGEWADAMQQYRFVAKRFPAEARARKRLTELEKRFGPLDQSPEVGR